MGLPEPQGFAGKLLAQKKSRATPISQSHPALIVANVLISERA